MARQQSIFAKISGQQCFMCPGNLNSNLRGGDPSEATFHGRELEELIQIREGEVVGADHRARRGEVALDFFMCVIKEGRQ